MAKTTYRNCWWLIQVVDGEFGSGSYRNGTGYSMRNINDYRPIGERIEWISFHERDTIIDEDTIQSKDKFRQMMMRWRTTIYNEFGLAIMQESTSGPDHHGNGGYYYYLANPELLEEGGKTLRDYIQFLAETETKRDDRVSLTDMTARFRGSSSSMGFISASGPSSYGFLSKEGTSYRTVLGEENLDLIQFAMQFGEVLTIKYGKVRTGVDFNAPYTLKPYQLKEIEGRWYVIGNLYPLGHKELAEIAVYDLARLQFADDENPDVLFEPVLEFNLSEELGTDGDGISPMGKVTSLHLRAQNLEGFADYLSKSPLFSVQEEMDYGEYKAYVRISDDLLIQLAAYGEELSFEVLDHDYEAWIKNRVRCYRDPKYFLWHGEKGDQVAIIE